MNNDFDWLLKLEENIFKARIIEIEKNQKVLSLVISDENNYYEIMLTEKDIKKY